MFRETRTVPLEIRELDERGWFDGHASVFGVVDTYGTEFDRGCFKKTLREHKNELPLTRSHDWMTGGIGMARGVNEDDTGLRIKEGWINLKSAAGKEVYVGLPHPDDPASGYYRDMSHGFDRINSKKAADGVEHITEVRSYEIAIVMRGFGATPGAEVDNVRAIREGMTRLEMAVTHREAEAIREAMDDLRMLLNVMDGGEPSEFRPYPNEHACRLLDPDEFVRFIRKTVESGGKKLSMIIGYREDDTTDVQAFRYPRATWEEDEARAHCKAHDGKTFEPATGADSVTCAPDEGTVKEMRALVAELGPSADTQAAGEPPIGTGPQMHPELLEELRAIGAGLRETLDRTR